MPCNPLTGLTGCLGPSAGGQVNAAGATGWDGICQSFAKAADQLLTSFAKAFVAIPPVSLSYSGLRSVYGLSLDIAALIAAMLLMVQVIRTVLAHDASAIAQGLTGVGKAALAFLLTLAAAGLALRASDELTRWIIARTFGSPQALSNRLAHLVTFDPHVSASLLLILALLAILLTIALWGQLLVRNIALTVLVAVSPVAAAGQVAHATQQWWRKLVRAAIQLIALKPAVALIFAVGLTMPAASGPVEKLLTGMLVLLLAGCAWPAMARASAVLEVYVGGGTLAGIRGGTGARSAAAVPGGVAPADLSRVAEARTMAAVHELRSRSGRTVRATPEAGRPAVPVRAGIGKGKSMPNGAEAGRTAQGDGVLGDRARDGGLGDHARDGVLGDRAGDGGRPAPPGGDSSRTVPGSDVIPAGARTDDGARGPASAEPVHATTAGSTTAGSTTAGSTTAGSTTAGSTTGSWRTS
jgi:hypothetical protein